MRTSLSYSFSAMARKALKDPAAITNDQLTDLGVTARAIFDAAWSAEHHDHALMRNAIFAVVQTFDSDPAASEQLLRRLLSPERVEQCGYEDIPDLAHELSPLHRSASSFCADVYETAFSREEKSNETTVMTTGVVGMTSNRGQDWRGARYALAQDYASFLEQSPEAAVQALIVVRTAYAERRGYARLTGDEPQQVDVSERHTAFIPDAGMSDIYVQEDESTVLAAFTERLQALAQEAPADAVALINMVLDQQAPAAVWRSMFSVGAEHPAVLVSVLGELCTAPTVLQAGDLTPAVPQFLTAAYGLLKTEQRGAIEDSIVALDAEGWREHHRNILLASLPEELLVTEEARALRTSIDVDDALRAGNDDNGWHSVPYDEDIALREQGVDMDSDESAQLDALLAPVKEFVDNQLNAVPTVDDAHAITPALVALRDLLDESTAHQLHRGSAWGYLAQAARAISKQSDIACDDDTRTVVLAILLAAVDNPDPAPHEDDAAYFDSAESWGSNATRANAVDGLMRLASRAECNDVGATEAIERLTADPSAVVRYHAGGAVAILANGQVDLAWKLIDQLATDDSLLVRETVIGALAWMWRLDKPRVIATTKAIYDNAGDKEKSVRLRNSALTQLAHAYVVDGDTDARTVLDACIAGLPAQAETVRALLFPLRSTMTAGAVDGSEPDIDARRLRAIGLVDQLLTAALAGQVGIEQQEPRNMNEWPQERLDEWKANAQLIDTINMEFHFASGAHRDQNTPESEHKPTPAQKRFYDEAGSLADRLATAGYPSCAHHLLETLEFFIDVDPRGAFLRIAATIRGGQRFGYEGDVLAPAVFVRIVERYLAEHRSLLQQDAECSAALVDILDIFVRAGWPAARRLTYGLDEIYR
jgi:hypothetical protein